MFSDKTINQKLSQQIEQAKKILTACSKRNSGVSKTAEKYFDYLKTVWDASRVEFIDKVADMPVNDQLVMYLLKQCRELTCQANLWSMICIRSQDNYGREEAVKYYAQLNLVEEILFRIKEYSQASQKKSLSSIDNTEFFLDQFEY